MKLLLIFLSLNLIIQYSYSQEISEYGFEKVTERPFLDSMTMSIYRPSHNNRISFTTMNTDTFEYKKKCDPLKIDPTTFISMYNILDNYGILDNKYRYGEDSEIITLQNIDTYNLINLNNQYIIIYVYWDYLPTNESDFSIFVIEKKEVAHKLFIEISELLNNSECIELLLK